jgi:hypothetical protein
MAYSSSFLDNRNKIEGKLTSKLNANDSSSNKIDFGKILQWKKECIKYQQQQNRSE